MENENLIKPFSWSDYDDGKASVTLYTSHNYKKEMFETRKSEGAVGSGYDWESLARVFIQEKIPDVLPLFDFDPEHMMFCVYSTDTDALERFILLFKEACEDDNMIADIFSRAILPEPIKTEDLLNAFKMMGVDIENDELQNAFSMMDELQNTIKTIETNTE